MDRALALAYGATVLLFSPYLPPRLAPIVAATLACALLYTYRHADRHETA
jgi:hypothetical protein